MMKKILPILLIGILVISGLGAANYLEEETEIIEKIEVVSFQKIIVSDAEDGYLSIDIEGANDISDIPNKPMLPLYRQTFTFSKNVKIKDVSCIYSDVSEMELEGKIQPAPEALPTSFAAEGIVAEIIEDPVVYENSDLFPGDWYTYNIRCGVNEKGVAKTFVTVEVNPVQYSPAENIVNYVNNAEIEISYQDPGDDPKKSSADSYNLLIITPSDFEEQLQVLVDHKESVGVSTKMITLDEIYDQYDGVDPPEQIKHCILDEEETYNIDFVLLMGGLKNKIFAKDKEHTNYGAKAWYFPVRYAHVKEGGEVATISDLYYSDLYRYNEDTEEWEFEDWDQNGNGIFAEGSMVIGKSDKLDLTPDVFYGRLACRNSREVNTVINKIIDYESTSPADKTWFKNMVVVAGKTFSLYNGTPDGEVVCNTALDYMGDLVDPVKCYASNNGTGGLRPIPDDIKTAFMDGAGYVNFQGHGNPVRWDTIWADGEYNEHDWAGGTSIYEFMTYFNRDMLPIVIIGGCHNALFNVTLIKTLLSSSLGHDMWYWTHGSPATECFSWQLVSLPYGGAIASTGCTGYGMGGGGPVSRSAELEANFFYQIGQEDITNAGAAHSLAVAKYVNETSIGNTEKFVIVVYQFFGDPSLKIGGYE